MSKRFKNFSIWRGRLPHWRADDEIYYITFRHKRALDEAERLLLFRPLLSLQSRFVDYLALGVFPESTEAIFKSLPGRDGQIQEFSGLLEKAKQKAGKAICKKTGERFPPFYFESFDRIIRDEPEFHERLETLLQGPLEMGLAQKTELYETLWVSLPADEELFSS